jgi:hypothetical protein
MRSAFECGAITGGHDGRSVRAEDHERESPHDQPRGQDDPARGSEEDEQSDEHVARADCDDEPPRLRPLRHNAIDNLADPSDHDEGEYENHHRHTKEDEAQHEEEVVVRRGQRASNREKRAQDDRQTLCDERDDSDQSPPSRSRNPGTERKPESRRTDTGKGKDNVDEVTRHEHRIGSAMG